jgi:hypothetical protein
MRHPIPPLLLVPILAAGATNGLQAAPLPLAQPAPATAPDVASRIVRQQRGTPWPDIDAVKIPLYPDFRAFLMGRRRGSHRRSRLTLLFASQTSADRVLDWYAHRLPAWKLDRRHGLLVPPGCTAAGALHDRCSYVEVQDVAGGRCGIAFRCRAQAAVSYAPGGPRRR